MAGRGTDEDVERSAGMSRYINADRVHRDCEMRFADTGVPYEWAYALTIIDQATTADVTPVVHARWDDNIIGFCNVCMECGAIVDRTAIKNRSGELNYCPNCGAKMDGEDESND